MRSNVLMKLALCIVCLLTLISFTAASSPSTYAKSSVNSRTATSPSLVPCTSAYNKVGLKRQDGSWVCYGNSSGSVYIGFVVVELDADNWSGDYEIGLSTTKFCNQSKNKVPSYRPVDYLDLSPKRVC